MDSDLFRFDQLDAPPQVWPKAVPLPGRRYICHDVVFVGEGFAVLRCADADGGLYARGVIAASLIVASRVEAWQLSADEELCSQVCDQVRRVARTRECLEVVVQGGEVTLAGTIESLSSAMVLAVEDAVAQVPGVRAVINGLLLAD